MVELEYHHFATLYKLINLDNSHQCKEKRENRHYILANGNTTTYKASHMSAHTPITKPLDLKIQGTEEHVKGHHKKFHQQNSA